MTKIQTKPRAASAPEARTTSTKQERPKPTVVLEWEQYMGKGALEDWQRLMKDLGFEGEFPSKTQCKKALKGVWVNIPDFLAAVKNGEPVHRFPSRRELAQYTRDHRRYFPKKGIKKGSPLRQLLAHLFGTRTKYRARPGLVSQMGGLSLAQR